MGASSGSASDRGVQYNLHRPNPLSPTLLLPRVKESAVARWLGVIRRRADIGFPISIPFQVSMSCFRRSGTLRSVIEYHGVNDNLLRNPVFRRSVGSIRVATTFSGVNPGKPYSPTSCPDRPRTGLFKILFTGFLQASPGFAATRYGKGGSAWHPEIPCSPVVSERRRGDGVPGFRNISLPAAFGPPCWVLRN